MPSAPVLRLTVLIPREQVPASPSVSSALIGSSNGNPKEADPPKPRKILLVIKEPEEMSLGHLANLIKEQWVEFWPNDEPLGIKRLVNEAYPDAAFSVRLSVADIWFDQGRAATEGFDQDGIVHVIRTPTSFPPSGESQWESSVSQDLEGAAYQAKRKFLESEGGTDSSLNNNGQAVMGPSTKRQAQPDPDEHQSKRRKLTAENDSSSSASGGSPHPTRSSPMFYVNRPVPKFAWPRGHRRHLSKTSTGTPKKGLGIMASPERAAMKAAARLAAEGSLPLPPPPFSPAGRPNTPPLRSSTPKDSPLASREPAKRPSNQIPASISNDEGPRTRATTRALTSGKRSHPAASIALSAGVSKSTAIANVPERDRKELQEVKKLFGSLKTNPDCLDLLEDIRKLHEHTLTLKADSTFDSKERTQLIGINRKRLYRRRKQLQKLRENGKLYEVSHLHTDTSEGAGTYAEAAVGNDQKADKNPETDALDIQVVIGVHGSDGNSLSPTTPVAQDCRTDATTASHPASKVSAEDEDMTGSEGGDIDFDGWDVETGKRPDHALYSMRRQAWGDSPSSVAADFKEEQSSTTSDDKTETTEEICREE